jgi:aminoglycoside phosphotransferase (APT) family kinase protein
MVAAFGDDIPPHIAALKDRFLAALPMVFEWMAEGPLTVLHGDVRMDNLFFGTSADQEPLIAVDWQGSLRGRAAQDLGYFMSGSLPVETRRKHERELLSVWHDELCAAGVTGYTADDAWQDYRRGTLFVWTHAVVISGTLDLANERGKAWVREMLVRSVAAFDDLKLIELLEEIESR